MGYPLLLRPCGTYAAYQRHRLGGEVPCDQCTEAAREYMRDWHARNPGKKSEYEKNRTGLGRNLARPYRDRRSSHLLDRYGLTSDQFDEIHAWQGNVCLCCGTGKIWDRQKPWQVDHAHEPFVLRGITCSRCNRGIAQAGDCAYGVAATFARYLAYLAASGDALTDEQVEQLISAIRGHHGLVGEGAADPDRSPREQHEAA